MDSNLFWLSPDFFAWLRENSRLVVFGLIFVPGLLALVIERLTSRSLPQGGGASEAATVSALSLVEAAPEPTPGRGEELPVTAPPTPDKKGEESEQAAAVTGEPAAAPIAEVEPAAALIAEPEPAAALIAEPEPAAAPKPSLRDRLARTSETLVGRLGGILGGRKVDADLLEELEAALYTADLGVATAESLLERVKKEATGADAEGVREILHDAILEKLLRVEGRQTAPLTEGPHVILVLGVNGAGKTTSIGKLAARYAAEGKKVVLGAGDTFRAAAVDQLQIWGERVGCEVIAGKSGGDPAAVAFDTVKAAIAAEADIAIIDTAGRLQTKKPLMEELGKIARVLGRDLPGAPHETLLVLDSNTGQNAISQARLFTEVTTVTGLILTKLDGSAKGGVIVGLADEFGIPVHFVGVGEGIEDLQDFQAEEFVDALFGEK
ncbi:MAG: signal recognition particle-docking protein FtsY [Myxococcota bacterium]|nr:signal recognition particle-docking protein FtsY [Myxococcota bacterium]